MTAYLVLVCRLVAGGVFVFASLSKISDPAGFARSIHHFQMVPYFFLHPMAYLLPWLELIAGGALVLGVARRGAALLVALMSLVFIVALGTALARGLDISCGCFNTDGGHEVGMDLLVRDVGLLLMCLPPLLASSGRWELERLWRRKGTSGES